MTPHSSPALSTMTLEEKVAQLFTVCISGLSMTEELADYLQTYAFGSVYLTDLNYINPTQFSTFCSQLKETLYGEHPILSARHEGGRISRFGLYNATTPFPLSLSQTNDTSLARHVGTLLGAQLSTFGVNFNWAPDLNIFNDMTPLAMQTQSLGQEQNLVSTMGSALIQGMHEAGIGCGPRHFPGLGAYPVLFDKENPVGIMYTSNMNEDHLRPFQAAINQGANAIMLGDLIYYDGANGYRNYDLRPIANFLREEMGFEKVVASSERMSSPTIPTLSIDRFVKQFLSADIDMMVFGSDTRKQLLAFETIVEEVKRGHVPIERIDKSVLRILNMRRDVAQLQQKKQSFTMQESTALFQRLSQATVQIHCPPPRQLPYPVDPQEPIFLLLPYEQRLQDEDFIRTLNCCLCDVMTQLSNQMVCHYYNTDEDLAFHLWTPDVIQSKKTLVVFDRTEKDAPLVKWINSLADYSDVTCFIYRAKQDISCFAPSITTVELLSYSDYSLQESIRQLFIKQ